MSTTAFENAAYDFGISLSALQSLAPAKSAPGQTPVTRIVSMSQAAYDALAAKDPATLYIIAS